MYDDRSMQSPGLCEDSSSEDVEDSDYSGLDSEPDTTDEVLPAQASCALFIALYRYILRKFMMSKRCKIATAKKRNPRM